MSEALKSNTTLTALDLGCKYKRRRHRIKVLFNNKLCFFLILSTDNKIGFAGTKALCEALKSNKTLMKLNLSC